MRLLALDIATRTGWAMFEDGKRIGSGVWDLDEFNEPGESADERLARRCYQMRVCLSDIFAAGEVSTFAYENVSVGAHTSRLSARLHGALRGVALGFAYSRECTLVGPSVQAVKKALAGKGNAAKWEVVNAAAEMFGCGIEDDNEADALGVAVAAMEMMP